MLATRRAQSFTGHTIDALQNFHDRLGFWPKLVFDRGFGNESLITHLAAERATFYVRLKAGRYIELDGQRTSVSQLPKKDSLVMLFGLTLRVIRTAKSRRHPEPWYILTNDFDSSRTKIARIYYHRFEIEETFKDMKHLFELKRVQFNKPNSLKVLLWFVSLSVALLYMTTRAAMHQEHDRNNKKRRSWVRVAWEQFERELMSYRGLTGLAPRPERAEM
jgi:IS4 transposase